MRRFSEFFQCRQDFARFEWWFDSVWKPELVTMLEQRWCVLIYDDFISNRSTCSKFVAAPLIRETIFRWCLSLSNWFEGYSFCGKKKLFRKLEAYSTYFGKLLRSSRSGVLHWKRLLTLLAASLTTRAHLTTTPNCWNPTRNEASKIHASLKNLESLTCQSFRIRIPFFAAPFSD